ncbi:MAG: glycosyltransferase [Ignavibacteriales bacterium]|nr:glycosyltransferase [Ignavibacteriales bacterium]
MKKKVLILSNHNYQNPSGAAYSRIICYAKAICIDKTYEVTLASFRHNKNLHELSKVHDRIHYIGKCKVAEKKRNNFKKFYDKYLYFLESCYFIYSLTKKVNRETRIIFFSMKIINDLIILLYLKKIKKFKIFIEKNEMLSMIPNNNKNKIAYHLARINDRLVKYYDGVIAISTKIEEWAKKRNQKVLRIPILCEIRDYVAYNPDTKIFKIVYTGTVSEQKDGVFSLIKVIEKITKTTTSNVRLDIYGTGNPREIDTIITYLEKNKILNITLHGNIPYNQIYSKIIDASLLILPRPWTNQNNYGFSTKLAEYLSTGRAVIATDVSDNSLYIKDGINGFIVESSNFEKLESKLRYILNRKEKLVEVGYQGYELAKKYFFYDKYSKRLIEFLV